MRIPRFYVPEVAASGEIISVTGQTAHHVTQVLRLRPGALIRLFNGHGPEWEAVLLQSRRAGIQLEVGSAVATIDEPSICITLAQGITRNDRMDFILQKAVELGVSRILPLWMQRSQGRVRGDRLEKRCRHWQGVIISACEQCGRSTLPQLSAPENYAEWIGTPRSSGHCLMLQPDSNHVIHDLPPPPGDSIVLVGPEGGLEAEEQQLATAAGFTGIRLGQRILRTETAALSALACMQALWGDFRD